MATREVGEEVVGLLLVFGAREDAEEEVERVVELPLLILVVAPMTGTEAEEESVREEDGGAMGEEVRRLVDDEPR